MSISIFSSLGVTLLVGYGLAITKYAWTNEKGFSVNQRRIRRTFYGLLFSVIAIGYWLGFLCLANWVYTLLLFLFGVFMDLAILQTPNVLKIFNSEFEHEDLLRTTVVENDRTIELNMKKASDLAVSIQTAESYLSQFATVENYNEYIEQLEEFLKKYANKYFFELSFKRLATDESQVENELKAFVQTFVSGLGLSIKAKEEDTMVARLKEQKAVFISDLNLCLQTFFGQKYNFIIITKTKHDNLLEVDPTFFVILAIIFDWFMVKPEDEMV